MLGVREGASDGSHEGEGAISGAGLPACPVFIFGGTNRVGVIEGLSLQEESPLAPFLAPDPATTTRNVLNKSKNFNIGFVIVDE
jgi:hypothetical protein